MGLRNARELIELWFGDRLVSNWIESDVTVGTSVVALTKYNGARVLLILSNSGAAAVSISTKTTPTATTGIQIAAGATQVIDWQTYLDLPTAAWNAIAGAAGNGVHVTEVVLVGPQE